VINIRSEIIMKAFGKRLKELRLSKKLSQEQLGHLAQINVSQIGRIERGEINPTISTVYILSLALKLSPKVLMDVDLPNHSTQLG
jgi:transcriptional regulator with XRE-family HTH domain